MADDGDRVPIFTDVQNTGNSASLIGYSWGEITRNVSSPCGYTISSCRLCAMQIAENKNNDDMVKSNRFMYYLY